MKGTMIRCGYAMVTGRSNESITYDNVKWLESEESGGREYNFTPKGDPKEIYADGKVVFAANKSNGYDGTVTLIDLIDDVAKDFYGQKIGENGERAEYAFNQKLPMFAWIQIEEETDGTYRTTVYPYVHCSKRPDKKGKTSEEGNFDFEFVQHNFAIRPRPTDMLVCYETKSDTIETPETLPSVPEFEDENEKKNQE